MRVRPSHSHSHSPYACRNMSLLILPAAASTRAGYRRQRGVAAEATQPL
jgi:hypothetical protein